jgi:outer membrane protein assembly factor BamB
MRLLLPVLLPLAGCVAGAADSGSAARESAAWNRFRGPNGTGIAEGDRYPTELGPAADALWSREFPEGFSSPILSRTRVFLTGVEDERLFTYALDRASGETLWKREAPRPRRTEFLVVNHPAAASAAVDEDTVVVFFDEYGLLAYDHEGAELWRLPLGPFNNVYGMGASPILVDDVVVLACDQSTDSYVIGVSKEDGRVLWRQERPSAISGHCTPVVHHIAEGRDEVLLPGSYLLDAYDARTGERLWWIRGLPSEMKSVPMLLGDVLWTHGFASPLNNRGQQIALPPFDRALVEMDVGGDGYLQAAEIADAKVQNLFVFFDLDGDGRLGDGEWQKARDALAAVNSAMAIRLGGRGDLTDTNVLWRVYRDIPQLPSPLVYASTYYMLGDQGGLLTTLDPDTGERLEKGRLEAAVDAYYASPVAADGKVYLLSEAGLLTVLAAGQGIETLHTADFDERCYATPALEDGRVWLRTERHLYCFGLAPNT